MGASNFSVNFFSQLAPFGALFYGLSLELKIYIFPFDNQNKDSVFG
jgi:hypothetical protein